MASFPILEGRKGIILGVANKRSIAWSIAESTANAGAKLAFSYQNDRLKDKVEKLTDSLSGDKIVEECDVADDASIDKFFDRVKSEWGTIDFLVHAVAFAKREELDGHFADTSRDGFALAHDISAYSLVGTARKAAELMPEGGSIVTLSYYGAEKVIPNYNIMGVAKASLEASVRYLAADLGEKNIRVNAISAGPINTLAARGIAGFTDMLANVREKAPLRRNTEPAEVGDTALFLVSDLARGITGETLYVDNGYNVVAM
jgi:enoyl-[acyl-carrier protein] reductase I